MILSKIIGYVKTFKVKDGDKDNDIKLVEKYKTIWTKIEDLENIELNAFSVYDDRYIKTKVRTYGIW